MPLAPTVAADTISYCQGVTATALSASGASLKWYTVATGGTATTSAPTPSTASAGVFTYYVSQSNSFSCESPRKPIVVIINATPTAPGVTSPVEYCSGTTAAALTAVSYTHRDVYKRQGLAVSAELAQPVSVVRDGSGNVYISDQGNHRIRKITSSTGNISTIAGTTTSGFSGDGGCLLYTSRCV